MPQLEASTYITQVFWLVTTFCCLWFIMAKVIVPKISETIETRKRKLDDFILKAEEINQKALTALNRYETTLAAAKATAMTEIAQNEQELKKIIMEKEEEITKQLKQKIAESEASLNKEKKTILKQMNILSQDMAYEILQKLDIKSITREDIETVMQEKKIS